MAGSSDSDDRGRRRSLADLYGHDPEERENRSDEETEDDDDYNIHGDATGDSSARANNGDARARPPPSSSVAASKSRCDSCAKEFRSREAVCEHMKVHQEAEQGIGKENRGAKRDAPVLTSYWGVTRKRHPSSAQESDQFIVVADPEIVLEPMPLSSATPSPSSVPVASATATDNDVVESSGAQTVDNDNDAVKTEVVEGAASPEGDVVHRQAAPPSQPAAVNPASPPPVQQQEQPAVAPPPPRGGRQNPDGYTCNECGMWFPTYQALGGHTKSNHYDYTGQPQQHPAAVPPRPRGGRQNPDGGYKCNKCDKRFPTQQALSGHAAAHTRKERAAGLQDGAGPQEAYVCTVCGAEYPDGYQLRDHVMKHIIATPISNKPRLDIAIPKPLPPPDTATAAPVKTEEASSAPSSPAAAGSLLGIDIKEEAAVVAPPAAQQGSSAGEAEAASPDTHTGEKR